jgi:hypothetical protein
MGTDTTTIVAFGTAWARRLANESQTFHSLVYQISLANVYGRVPFRCKSYLLRVRAMNLRNAALLINPISIPALHSQMSAGSGGCHPGTAHYPHQRNINVSETRGWKEGTGCESKWLRSQESVSRAEWAERRERRVRNARDSNDIGGGYHGSGNSTEGT